MGIYEQYRLEQSRKAKARAKERKLARKAEKKAKREEKFAQGLLINPGCPPVPASRQPEPGTVFHQSRLIPPWDGNEHESED